MANRRQFIQAGGLAAVALAFPEFGFAKRSLIGGATSLEPKLGLFFGEGDVETLAALFSSDPMFADLRDELAAIDRVEERRFMAEDIRYNDHLYDLPRIANLAPKMAFLYALTDDEDAGTLAAECIRELMKFPKWDYFLEGGDRVFGLQRASAGAIAVALTSDWLGDSISNEERTTWMTTMGERGCEACFLALYGMRYKDRVEGWTMDETSTFFEHRPDERTDLSNWPTILDRTNLKAVPASALAVAAVAHEKFFGPSEDTERWIEQAVYSVSSFKDLYAPDGSYNENISYAHYTSEHLIQAIVALERSSHAHLTDLINWPGFVDFIEGMSMPTNQNNYDIVNFGDAGSGMLSSVPFWIAERFGDGRGQWFGRTMTRGHNLWSVLWYNPNILNDVPVATPSLYRSELDWIVARTGYEADDLVVAMRSGGPSNHEHADRNSLIVKCFGETLVADPYRPPYSFADPSWKLRTTAGHSSLLIDGEGHQYHDGSEGTNPSDAYAKIVRTVERGDYMYWASDATEAYQLVNADIESVTRSVIVMPGSRAVIVLDKVIKREEASIVQARYFADNRFGDAEISATDRTFIIRRPEARLVGLSWASTGRVLRTGQLDIPEERASQHPFVDVVSSNAAIETLLVTLLLPQRSDQTASTGKMIEREDGGIDVRVQSGFSNTIISIVDEGRLPEFKMMKL